MDIQPALRLHGRGERVRLRRIGSWNRDPLTDLALTCRTTVAVDKALGESVDAARQAGRSWTEIASAMGLPATLSSWQEISEALAASRQQIWKRTADDQ
jgi:hypothetical protein